MLCTPISGTQMTFCDGTIRSSSPATTADCSHKGALHHFARDSYGGRISVVAVAGDDGRGIVFRLVDEKNRASSAGTTSKMHSAVCAGARSCRGWN